jgi:hypothetical protein
MPPPAWRFIDIDESVSSPPDAGEPRPRRRNGRGPRWNDDRRSPAGKPPRRRSRIESAHIPEMLPDILQHVDERVPDLARRREDARMISVGPQLPTPTERAIDRLGDTDGEPLKAAL